MSVELHDKGSFKPQYSLSPNVVEGFETAVNNGQTRLALEYAVKIIHKMRRDIIDLKQAKCTCDHSVAEVAPIVSDEALVDTVAKSSKKVATKKETKAEAPAE